MNALAIHLYLTIRYINLSFNYFGYFYRIIDTGHESYIKSYIYITWMLWGFLVNEEKRIFIAHGDNYVNLPVYSQLRGNNEWKIISFNYTTFASQFTDDRAIYFHGSLRDYIEIETKISSTITDEEYNEIDVVSFFDNNIKPNIDFASADHRYTIPSFLPPLKLKPVLGKKFISDWYDALKAVEDSDKIIIGYSFNASDEHFNGLLRDCLHKNIFIIDTDAKAVLQRLAPVIGIDPTRRAQRPIQGKTAYILNSHITIIEASAHEINLSQL